MQFLLRSVQFSDKPGVFEIVNVLKKDDKDLSQSYFRDNFWSEDMCFVLRCSPYMAARPSPLAVDFEERRHQWQSRETKDTVRVDGWESFQECLLIGSSQVSSCGFWQDGVRLPDLLE